MGFSGYFLIVWDLIRSRAGRRASGSGPGRGSAAGSVVSYALRITDLDPIRYGLLFERFLNPGRIQMPDIDMDFDERRRDEMIRYAAEQVRRRPRRPDRHVPDDQGQAGRSATPRGCSGFPASVGDKLCKMYPPAVMGRDEPIDRALEISPESRATAYETRARGPARSSTRPRALEGLRREDSVHAAGVVIGDAPLVNYLPAEAHEGLARRLEEDRHAVRHARASSSWGC